MTFRVELPLVPSLNNAYGTNKHPPDSSFQAGFLAAVCIIYREALNNKTDDRITLAERLLRDAPKIVSVEE